MKKMRCGACGEDKVYVFSEDGVVPIVIQCCTCGSETFVRAVAKLETGFRRDSPGVMTVFPDEKETE